MNREVQAASKKPLSYQDVDGNPRRAVIYLRVSTPSQVNTDYDPEGISIPAQRSACEHKAEQMGVDIVDEYVEPGKSGTSMTQRPAFQAMLSRIKQDRDVDYVIVYKLSRMNRNRIDDALVLETLRKHKVTLISATENIDETPVGQLIHGVLAAINEFRSAEDGADIRYKMAEKARRGGTLGKAPLGYLNVRENFEGREIRTIAVDPERASLIKLAFELYATGDYTITRLTDELNDRGLRTRPARYAGRPLSVSKVQELLRDRYYIGWVSYKGTEEHRGRHEALIDEDLFERVQVILDGKSSSGERERVHHHYLKGTVWCGECHDRGETNRLLFSRATGRHGGIYFYFHCRGRQHGRCAAPYIPSDRVEDAVVRHYRHLRLDPGFAEKVREKIGDALGEQEMAVKLRQQQITRELLKLDRQEENLLDLASEASVPKEKLRVRLSRIRQEREKLQCEVSEVDADLQVGAALLEAAIELLGDPEELYRQASESQRRLLNQTFFERLYVDHGDVTSQDLVQPFKDLVEAQSALFGSKRRDNWSTQPKDIVTVTVPNALQGVIQGGGSSKTEMVEVSGLEPPTSTLRT
jgi:site-specific DNA recombinase